MAQITRAPGAFAAAVPGAAERLAGRGGGAWEQEGSRLQRGAVTGAVSV